MDARNEHPHYLNPDLPVGERIADLLGQMTLAEKAQQLVNDAPAIDRLDVPAYNYWNEALHGVARAGLATVFPQAIGLAATWDTDLVHRAATVISDEGRAKHHAAVRHGTPTAYTGLTFWSPNINIFRDPRWGRGHETYGEDPYLTARLGVAFIKGLQGDDPTYLKAAACAKHYAVHSGPESERFTFDATVSAKDLRETYLPAFEAAVKEAGVESVMGAYNRLYGTPCCASMLLLQEILREEWGFEGHVVSDCGAVGLFHTSHAYAHTPEESAALAVRAGCDLNCGTTYLHLAAAVEQGLLDEADLDVALTRVFRARFKLGLFDPPERVSFAGIGPEIVDAPAHRELARVAAQKSIVLLKNNGILPLDHSRIKSIMLFGPTAARADVLLGNYYGLNPHLVTPIEGILGKVGPETIVHYVMGCPLVGRDRDDTAVANYYARTGDVSIAVMGLAPELEGEAGDANMTGDPDRGDIGLPPGQEAFLKQLKASGKPLVLVLTGGSAMAVNWAQEHADAVLWIGYPGEEGGNALADVLFGDVSPAGRLPVTFYKSADDLPPFGDYAMAGRTYRYFEGEPLYPFGFGLSYTTFSYSNPALSTNRVRGGESLTASVTIANVGQKASDEVAQLYLRDLDASGPAPRCQLAGFQRVHLAPGEHVRLSFQIEPRMMQYIAEDGSARFEPGWFEVIVGGCSPGARGAALGAARPVSAQFELV